MKLTKQTVFLQTERLFLSRWEPGDAALLQELHGVEETTRFIGDGLPWSRALAEQRLSEWTRDFQRDGISKLKLSTIDGQRFIGRAGFRFYRREGFFELGCSIRREEWGNGYATEISRALSEWLFRNRTARQFMAFAENDNVASIAMLKKIGMTETEIAGMHGADHRLFRMQKPAA